MLKINEAAFRNHLKKYLDQVADQQETIVVTRENGKVVIVK